MTQQDKLIAVTGATGFIGRRLCAALVGAGFQVRALARSNRAAADGIEWVLGDLGSRAALERLVAGSEAVVHCAGAVRGATAADFDAVNVTGVANLLAAVTDVAPQARLLQISSLAAREPTLSHYAASKRAGEELVRAASIGATVIRPPAVYGPGDRELKPLLEGLYAGHGVIPGNPGRMSLIHVDDLVGAVLAWLTHPAADGDCYEIDDGHPAGHDWDEIIRAISALSGRPVSALRIPELLLRSVAALGTWLMRAVGRAPMLTPGKVRELFHPDWVVTPGNFTERTGFQPVFGLAKGLASTLGSGPGADAGGRGSPGHEDS